MQRNKVIASQQKLLDTHRYALAHLLIQEAAYGPNLVPAHIVIEIEERRRQVQGIKAHLRARGVKVEDWPEDGQANTSISLPWKLSSTQRWILASTVGGALGYTLGRLVFVQLPGSLKQIGGTGAPLAWVFPGLLFGLVLAALQWRVLHPRVPRLSLQFWLVISVISYALGSAVGSALGPLVERATDIKSTFPDWAITWLVFGLGQQWALARAGQRISFWGVACAVGGLAGALFEPVFAVIPAPGLLSHVVVGVPVGAIAGGVAGVLTSLQLPNQTQGNPARKALTPDAFLAQASSAAVPLLKQLLADGSIAPLQIEWHPTCFSIKVPIGGRPVGLVYAYQQRVEVYFGYLPIPAAEQSELRAALLRLDAGWKTSDKMLKIALEERAVREPKRLSEALTRELRALAQRHAAPVEE